MQLVENWVRSTFVALWLLGSIVALWPDYFETIALAEEPFDIGVAIEYRAEYCVASNFVVPIVEESVDSTILGFVHSFDSMIRMVNHMRLKLNIVDSVDVAFFSAIFVLFHAVESDIVILGKNLSSGVSRPRIPFELNDVDVLVFVQSCSSYCSRFGCRRCSRGALNFLPVDIGKFDNDLGIVVWPLALFRILLR